MACRQIELHAGNHICRSAGRPRTRVLARLQRVVAVACRTAAQRVRGFLGSTLNIQLTYLHHLLFPAQACRSMHYTVRGSNLL